MSYRLSNELSKRGYVIVSGMAMGVDALAHKGAQKTIAVLGGGVDIIYPKVNKSLYYEIEQNGLLLSPFEDGFRPTKWSFVVRNEMVVALGEILIITQADLQSGSLTSAKFAKAMNKEVYVLSHRAGESLGTQNLLLENRAKPIHDIDAFVNQFGEVEADDEFIAYCKSNPLYEEALARYQERLVEAEIMKEIAIIDGKIRVL